MYELITKKNTRILSQDELLNLFELILPDLNLCKPQHTALSGLQDHLLPHLFFHPNCETQSLLLIYEHDK